MPLFPNLNVWRAGDEVTQSHLNEVILAIQTFLNVTKLDATNIQAASIPPSCLSAPHVVGVIPFVLTPPGRNLDDYVTTPTVGKVYGANLTLAQVTYSRDLAAVTTPYQLKIFRVDAFAVPTAHSGSVKVFTDGNAQAITELDLSTAADMQVLTSDFSIAPLTVAQGKRISVRMKDLADFAHLPVQVWVWYTLNLQV